MKTGLNPRSSGYFNGRQQLDVPRTDTTSDPLGSYVIISHSTFQGHGCPILVPPRVVGLSHCRAWSLNESMFLARYENYLAEQLKSKISIREAHTNWNLAWNLQMCRMFPMCCQCSFQLQVFGCVDNRLKLNSAVVV